MEPSWRNALVLLVGSALLFQGIITDESLAKPGEIMVTNITNSSISLSWDRPADMNGTEYNFSITYRPSNQTDSKLEVVNFTTIIGLLSGTNYTITVATVIDNETKSESVVTTVFTKPNVVTNLSLVNRNTTSVTLSWVHPSDHKPEYRYRVETTGDPSSNITVADESITVAQLNPGTNYTFRVFTLAADETSADPATVSLTTEPNEVLNLMVVNVGTNFVTLNWTRPPDYKDGYQYIVLTKRNTTPTGDYRNTTVRSENATIKELTSGTMYSFTITTLTADGTRGGPVIEFNYTKPVQIPPENITVNNNSTTDKLIVSWAPPPGNVETFFVIVQGVEGFKNQTSTNSTSSVTFTNLRPGREYNISVITNSGPFNVTSASVRGITVPSTPGNISVTNFSTNSISLNWGAPADMDDGHYAFNVTYHNGSTTEYMTENTTATTISNLTSGTNYTISVATIGPGNLQSVFVSTTHFTKPNPIANLQVVQINTTSITLSWTRPDQYKVGYQYRVLTDGSPAPIGSSGNQTVRKENVSVTELTPGTNYTFSVITLAEDGTEADPVVVANYTEPVQIPQVNITVTNNGTTDTLIVSWAAAPGNVEKFFVIVQDARSLEDELKITNFTSPVTFTNLRPGREYIINVITNSGPFNKTSDNVQGITVPSIPGRINVTAFSTNSISLNWGPPANMDFGNYTFNVTYNNGSVTESMTANINSTTISNLTSGTNYTISVATVGLGQLQSAFVSKFQFTKPNPITNLQVVQINTTSITLSWTRPDQYKVEYQYKVLTDGSPAPIGSSGNQTVRKENVSVTELTPGTNYTFSIITLAEDGTEADPVVVANYTEPVKIPNKNISLSNENTTDSLTISWIRPPGGVENFTIDIEDFQNQTAFTNSTTVSSSTDTVRFSSLRPGRLYRVKVTTISGPHHITSDPVTQATIPSIPGSINVTTFSTNSISLNWGPPANMDFGNYTFNVTYNNGSVTESMTANINSTTISNLTSGTNYTISVATVGLGQLQSAFVSKFQFTKPNPITNLQVVQINTTSITLSWTRPDQYKVEYQYKVLTDGSPAPIGSSGNQTVRKENVSVTELTPGTNYTFSIITLAEDGTEADPVVVANYTEPVKIPNKNISLSNENTTDSLTISWIRPPGGVENFTIDIEDFQNQTAFTNSTTVSSSTDTVRFSSLRPGRLYRVKVTTISGPHHITSDPVTQATIPSPPGTIVVTSFTNSTIEFGWPRPENMDIGTYNFTVAYKVAQKANEIVHSVKDNKSIISDLDSGTEYIITVFTTIRENLISSVVTISLYTRPNPIRNPIVVSSNTTSINLAWDKPLGHKDEYKYRVQTDENPPSNNTVNINSITVSGLTSGDNFIFTVITLAANDAEGSPVSLKHCTDAAAVSSLTCDGVELHPILQLAWTCASGTHRGFHISAADSTTVITNNISSCPSKEKPFDLKIVAFFTNYSVNVTTLSCGRPSTPTSVDCRSGIARPPQPSGNLELPDIIITHKTMKFTIQEGAFNSSNGPLVAIAVIVTKEQRNNMPNEKALETAFSAATSTYVTRVIDLESTTQNTRRPALAAPISVNIGDNSRSHGYVNQELTPLTKYRLSLAGFTKVKFTANKSIDSRESFYSVYHYSKAFVSNQNPDVIVGAVVGTILGAIVIVFLVIMLFWWKKRTKSNNKNLTQLPISNLRVARNAISVDYFEGYFSKQHADSDCGFAEEYEELKPVGILQSTQAAQQPLNKPKNRYNNVLPYDISRVKLSVTGDPSSDYINANFMPGYNSKKEFIAAQGPLLNTVNDFWRMIWEHNVPAIVMLTKCVEQGRAKCEQYWPTERPLIFGDKIVTLTSEIVLQDWTIRDFTIIKEKSKEKRALRHFHFTGWPDHGVPSTTGVLIDFRNLVRQYINQYPMNGPTVVHCSAGVGRTGTFISIDHMIYQVDNSRKVDIWDTVHQLRMHRPLMVQTESQYVFLNKCALEYIRANKQPNDDAVYQNTPILIYENTSAIQAANGHAL
ncbi:receptor-type tyrosine-protein phosphatase eta isoform X1 [Carcharodon carcharias]|uniref:receptor-type tyrosine-protein phosphatase eta isoform X1 n=1 Tax=Carcharodon carcharias TaxID=13397 RepID=UPI001B7D9EC7|nr:receptor-type tyrosine-protein phosphatase eta isoform X1 [Carcharodon carcharias]